jgi:hypothetical protein
LDTQPTLPTVRRDAGVNCIDAEAAMARPSKPYHHSKTNDPVPGLYKCKDGRWRIVATGYKFTEQNEDRAIDKFYKLARALNVRPWELLRG